MSILRLHTKHGHIPFLSIGIFYYKVKFTSNMGEFDRGSVRDQPVLCRILVKES